MSTATLGTDISTPVSDEGLLDLDPAMRLVSGRAMLAQAIGRRITTRPGALAWIGESASYGLDVRDQVGSDTDARTAFALAAAVQAEVLLDERVRACEVTATVVSGVLSLVLRLADADGPFRLTLAISDVTIDLLRVTP